MSDLVDELKDLEGFSGMPYLDHLGKDTIGYGTLLPITREEADLLLRFRLDKFKANLRESVSNEYPTLAIKDEAWEILYNMAYQMGVAGVLKFRNMFVALVREDYVSAATEMLDSLWARQTSKRAKKLASRMRNLYAAKSI